MFAAVPKKCKVNTRVCLKFGACGIEAGLTDRSHWSVRMGGAVIGDRLITDADVTALFERLLSSSYIPKVKF